jgi:hypothetical protein
MPRRQSAVHRRHYLGTVAGLAAGLTGCLDSSGATSYDFEITAFRVPDRVPADSGFDFVFEIDYTGTAEEVTYEGRCVSRPAGDSDWTRESSIRVPFYGSGTRDVYKGVPFHLEPGTYEATIQSDQSKDPEIQEFEVVTA